MLFPNSSTTRDPALLLLFVGLWALLLLPVISNAQQQQDNNAAEELSSSSLVLGVDCSWPMHSFPLRHPNWEENHHVVHRYLQYMEGCSEYYSEEECRTSDRERMAMNYYQTAAMQNYTSAGYAKVEAPKAVVDTLQSFYHEHQRQHMIREKWPPGAIYTNHWSAPTKMVPLDGLPTATATTTMGDQPSLSKQQRAEIIAQIQPILETWSKMPLIPTSLYGIRQYGRGSILSPHVDRLPLVISAIINVAQDVEEPWPLEVIGHDGKALNITMEPGDLVSQELRIGYRTWNDTTL